MDNQFPPKCSEIHKDQLLFSEIERITSAYVSAGPIGPPESLLPSCPHDPSLSGNNVRSSVFLSVFFPFIHCGFVEFKSRIEFSHPLTFTVITMLWFW